MQPDNAAGDITQLLHDFDPDDPAVYNRLWQLMYDQLHGLAHHELRKWKPGQTLNTTALVHECFIKLQKADNLAPQNRKHFYRLARQAMRQLVKDYAKRRMTGKRGGGQRAVSLEDSHLLFPEKAQAQSVLTFDEALERYGSQGSGAQRGVQVVECIYFVGLTQKETAALLEVNERTVRRDFNFFKAWYTQHYAAA